MKEIHWIKFITIKTMLALLATFGPIYIFENYIK